MGAFARLRGSEAKADNDLKTALHSSQDGRNSPEAAHCRTEQFRASRFFR